MGCEDGRQRDIDPSKYETNLKQRLQSVNRLAQEQLRTGQEGQKERYNWGIQERDLQVGQRVFVLLPSLMSKFLTCWQGPFQIIKRIGLVNYEVLHPGHKCKKNKCFTSIY